MAGLCLHDTEKSFCAGITFLVCSLVHNQGELVPVELTSAYQFLALSCKRIQSHGKKLGRSCVTQFLLPASPKTLPLEKSLIYGFEGAISPSLQMIQKMMLLQNVAEISTGYKKIMPIVFCNE